MGRHVLRVQDREGRGPFRPGMTKRWADKSKTTYLPAFADEFGVEIFKEIDGLFARRGGWFGCAVANLECLHRWFTLRERLRLAHLRYEVVQIVVDEILRESPNQIVFWRKAPLTSGVMVTPWDMQG